MFDLSLVSKMKAEDMKKIEVDDLIYARFYYQEPSSQDKTLVESISNDVVFRNPVKRCGFDCLHERNEECFYRNYKEALMFFVMAYVGVVDGAVGHIYTRPILNALAREETNV